MDDAVNGEKESNVPPEESSGREGAEASRVTIASDVSHFIAPQFFIFHQYKKHHFNIVMGKTSTLYSLGKAKIV